MKALNQLFTFLSSVIILTVFTFGVANANNGNAMVAAKQFNAEEYAKAYAAEKVARAKAYAEAKAAITKAENTCLLGKDFPLVSFLIREGVSNTS